MANRRKKPRRKTARSGTPSKTKTQDPQMEKLIRAFARLNAAMESRPQPTAVQDSLDEFRELFAAFVGGSGVGGGSEQQLAHEDFVEGESDNEHIKQESMLEGLRDKKKNKGYKLERRYQTVENATLEVLVKLQAVDKRGKEASSQLVKQFERRDIGQVPTGYVTFDDPSGLYMYRNFEQWMLGHELHECAVRVMCKVASTINDQLRYAVEELVLAYEPQRQVGGDPKQIAKWISESYLQLEVIEGKAVRDDRKVQRLNELQAQLARQLEGLAELREHKRLAKHSGKAPAFSELGADHFAELKREMAEFGPEETEWALKFATYGERQRTPELVVQHLREHHRAEVPQWLTPKAVEKMADSVSLNQGSRGKSTAERVVLEWFAKRDYK